MSSLKRQQGAQARFVSLRLFVRCHKQGRGVEQVTQDSLCNLDADFPYEELEEPQLQRLEVALPCYVGAVVPVPDGGEGQKKECLNLTNKATMSLKIKEDENERSQTKPILPAGKPCKNEGHGAGLKVGATPKAFPTAGRPESLAGASVTPQLTLIHRPPIMP